MNENEWVDGRLDALTPASDWRPDVERGLARLRGRAVAAHRWVRMLGWSGAAATTAVVFLMAFPAPRAAAQRACVACLMAAQSFGSGGAANLKPVSARKAAPGFHLTDASGKAVELSDFKGKVVLLNFWATWCGGCKVEIPWFVGFHQAYGGQGLVVLGVSMDEEGWAVVKPFIAEKKIPYRILMGNSEIAAAYGGLEALPVTAMIDRVGRIAATHVGLIAEDEYRTEIVALLAGK